MTKTSTSPAFFKVTDIIDKRNWGSSLEVGKVYSGMHNPNNKAVYWTDPRNSQDWVFYVGDTCELVNK